MPQLLDRCRSVSVVALLILAVSVSLASAQPFNWLLPQGGETWTAGTTHTVEWSGGPAANVNVYAISLVPFQVADVIAVNAPNSGFAIWTLPPSLAPGQYQVFVEDVGLVNYTYGQTFNVQAGPGCTAGCSVTAVTLPFYGSPGGPCDPSVSGAQAAALAAIQPLINSGCANGYYLDQSSVIVDVTILPFGACYAGYSGFYIAEASAVFCCCPSAVPARQSTWGAVKSKYR